MPTPGKFIISLAAQKRVAPRKWVAVTLYVKAVSWAQRGGTGLSRIWTTQNRNESVKMLEETADLVHRILAGPRWRKMPNIEHAD